MHYEGNIIRPPSEANSILLQVTVGCSHNKCTFCGTYTGERFRIKSDAIINEDIAFAAQYCRRQRRVFLCDGDALIIPQKRLLDILHKIKKQLPWVTRVGVYANAKSLKMKTLDELKELQEQGLGIAYMGLESGDDVTLKKINKGSTSEHMIRMGQKARTAGIKLSITVILGIAGRTRSKIHARETGRVLSAMDPETMVAAVAQKTTWNIQNASTQGSPPTLKSDRKKPEVPNQPVDDAPNIIPKPTAQKARDPMEKSIRFFIMMLTAFFARVKPVSTMANPACIKNTRAAATSVQT